MKHTKSLIASTIVTCVLAGSLASGLVVLSAGEVAAKSENAGGNGKSESAKNKTKANGKSRAKHARYLKNLNAMCSNGKSQSEESNVYRINAYYGAQEAVADWTDEKSDAEALLVDYLDPSGNEFGSENFDLEAAIAVEIDPATLQALLDYETALGLEAAQHGALVIATRSEERAIAFETATEGPLYEAFQVFKNGCDAS